MNKHTYLYGTEIILEIDHQPLAFVNRANINNDRVMRWALHLQMYRYQVRIVTGSPNTTADLLKSLWVVENDYFNMCYLKGVTVVTMWIMVWIIHVRSQDKKLEVSPVFYSLHLKLIT